MTLGISRERLMELLEGEGKPAFKRTIKLLLQKECRELDPWLPIEQAPLITRIRLFHKLGYQMDGILWVEADRTCYTHYQELPEPPPK